MARVTVTVDDNTDEYLSALMDSVENATNKMGQDLQQMAKGAAPEKTGNLVANITLSNSASAGAYQADIESTAVDPNTGNDYVNRMHNGTYRLGAISRTKAGGRSRITGINKKVGRMYLEGSGDLVVRGYHDYMEQQVSRVNMKYGV